jgi:hypothetical protein
MEANLPLLALIGWILVSLGVAAVLDRRQHTSRGIPTIAPRYVSRRRR